MQVYRIPGGALEVEEFIENARWISVNTKSQKIKFVSYNQAIGLVEWAQQLTTRQASLLFLMTHTPNFNLPLALKAS